MMMYSKQTLFCSISFIYLLQCFSRKTVRAKALPTIIISNNLKKINLTEINKLTYQSTIELDCNFDLGELCAGFEHDRTADFQWRINQGSTRTNLTGPKTDHTVGTNQGSYIYAESSKPRLNGDIARFHTPALVGGGPRCVQFYFDMTGHTMGELSVYIRDMKDGTEKLKMRLTERFSNPDWKAAQFSFDAAMNTYQIIFESKMSFGIFGDIAIDDIKVASYASSCRFWPPNGRYKTPLPTPVPPKSGKDNLCGKRTKSMSSVIPSGRIIGGKESKLGEWPWMAMLLLKDSNNHGLLCGGTLIGVDWIITAAHCIGEITNRENIKVRLGVTRAFNGQWNSSTDYDIEDVYIHKQYRTEYKFNYDVALIKLKRPVILMNIIKPVCLSKKEVKPKQRCFVAGWGHHHQNTVSNDQADQFPKFLQHGAMLIQSQQDCVKAYGSLIKDAMFCAGNEIGTPDTCQYDSGGPLMCENDGQWSLVGITSWGDSSGCGNPSKYGVYTHVNKVKDWIKSVMYAPRRYIPLHHNQ